MGHYSFKTPDVGEGIVEVELIDWHIAVGDEVTEDQALADVMTDKANVELSSPVAGRVLKLACPAGEMVAVGSELVLFEVAGPGNEDEVAPESSTGEGTAETVAPPAGTPSPQAPPPPPAASPRATAPAPHPAPAIASRGKVLASPAVRRQALDAGIDLARVPGNGPAGRITHADLDAYIATPATATPRARSATEQFKVTGLRRVIAQKMQASKRTIPHFSYVEEIELDALEALRNHLNTNRAPDQPKLTLLPFLMVALVRAVERFPQANATFDDEAGVVTRYAGVHIGIATQTDQGLKVPVVHHAESCDLWANAAELQRVAEAARDNTATTAELSGSTITITSLGKLGGIVSTPVLNKPEVAIIGVNKAEDRVVARDGRMAIRRMMNLSSSFDHRIVDGYVAAELIQAIKAMLERPALLFLPGAALDQGVPR